MAQCLQQVIIVTASWTDEGLKQFANGTCNKHWSPWCNLDVWAFNPPSFKERHLCSRSEIQPRQVFSGTFKRIKCKIFGLASIGQVHTAIHRRLFSVQFRMLFQPNTGILSNWLMSQTRDTRTSPHKCLQQQFNYLFMPSLYVPGRFGLRTDTQSTKPFLLVQDCDLALGNCLSC